MGFKFEFKNDVDTQKDDVVAIVKDEKSKKPVKYVVMTDVPGNTDMSQKLVAKVGEYFMFIPLIKPMEHKDIKVYDDPVIKKAFKVMESQGNFDTVNEIKISQNEEIKALIKQKSDDIPKYKEENVIVDKNYNNIHMYISASSGSGKSYMAAEIIKLLLTHPKYQNHRVFIICDPMADKDKNFDGIKTMPIIDKKMSPPIRVDVLHPEFQGYSYKDFRNSIVLFDDISAIDKKFKGSVLSLQKNILQNSRKIGCVSINISHSAKHFLETL